MATTQGVSGAHVSPFDRFFEITKRKSTPAREIRGGLVTFFTMVYILALNPIIVGTTTDINGNLISGMKPTDPNAIPITMAMVAAATALIACVSSILMGVLGRFPIALAAGLGVNSMAAYVIAPKMTWGAVMGLIVWEGIVVTILVVTGVREAIFRAVPKELRIAISVGIGLFIAFIGLIDSGVIRAGSGTITTLGIGGSLLGWPVLIFVLGLFLMIFLYSRQVKGSILISILVMTVIAIVVAKLAHVPAMTDASGAVVDPTGWASNVPAWVPGSLHLPNLHLLGRVDMIGGFQTFTQGANGVFTASGVTVGSLLSGVLIAFSLLLADFFDTVGTVVAVGAEAGLLDKTGEPPRLREILLADSLGAILGGLGSTSSNTSFVESSAGVAEGSRTGFSSIVTGIMFALAIFLSPLFGMVPAEAVAPALVLVGFLMLTQVAEIPWTDLERGVPAYLTVIFMPFAYSITNGIGVGFISYVLLKIFHRKAREIHPLMWVTSALFVLYFLQGLLIK
jgi:AGZA family xanthine/uracil permease-like MFS transporter